MRPGVSKPGDPPSKVQRLALVAAKSGKLFDTVDGLCLAQPNGRMLPVRMFSSRVVAHCVAAGWAQRMDQGDGTHRVMTTVAGDAALAKPMRFVRHKPIRDDWKREALR